jgi:hypothetical protein
VVAVDWFVGEKPLQPDTTSIRQSNPTANSLPELEDIDTSDISGDR